MFYLPDGSAEDVKEAENFLCGRTAETVSMYCLAVTWGRLALATHVITRRRSHSNVQNLEDN